MRGFVLYVVAVVCISGGQRNAASAQDSLSVAQELRVHSAGTDVSLADSLSERLATLPNSVFGRLQAADLRLFYGIYTIDQPAFNSYASFGDVTAYPAFYGSVPAAFASSLIGGTSATPAVRLALSEAAAYLLSDQIKNVAERFRPVRHIDFLSSGTRSSEDVKSYGFPSGHAAVASALVTSWSLSHPEWYVIAPGSIWVASVGVSRIWKGRHYPGDVVAGILLGTAVGFAVHELSR